MKSDKKVVEVEENIGQQMGTFVSEEYNVVSGIFAVADALNAIASAIDKLSTEVGNTAVSDIAQAIDHSSLSSGLDGIAESLHLIAAQDLSGNEIAGAISRLADRKQP